MKINHVANELRWYREDIYNEATTLILGSFNPNNPNGNNADYYYGRSSNYFWCAIAEIIGKDSGFFLNNLEGMKDAMLYYKFCFLDVISTIEISSEKADSELLKEYVTKKIFAGFSDQVLFTSQTNYNGVSISLRRTYNPDLFKILDLGKINKIIHTMGNNRISQNLKVKPVELNKGYEGFQEYINKIESTTDVVFVRESFSPSARVINRNRIENLENLKAWLNANLNLK